MEIAVLGAGYVGLVQAAGLASTGNDVYLADISPKKIDQLKQGICPIYEPGLNELLQVGNKKGYLHYFNVDSSEFYEKLRSSDIIFVAVGTPQAEDGQADLQYLLAAAELLTKLGALLDEKVLVVKSTVPVGTGDRLENFFHSKNCHPKLVSNPEFLKQGAAVQDFLRPERVIVGTDDSEVQKLMHFLYKPFMMKKERLIFMSRRSAELVKYACNAFLATKISFINEMSRLAEAVNANIQEVREGMISDSRIGDQFLFPGIGYGGSCLPKDTQALMAQGKAAGVAMKIVEASERVNASQKTWIVEKLDFHFNGNLNGRTIGIWGLAFKPNTDDLRAAPSVSLFKALFERGAKIKAHDPAAMENVRAIFETQIKNGQLQLVSSPYEASVGCDALAVLTEWQEYRSPNFRKLGKSMLSQVLFDGRNIYDPEMLKKFGFKCYGIGRA